MPTGLGGLPYNIFVFAGFCGKLVLSWRESTLVSLIVRGVELRYHDVTFDPIIFTTPYGQVE